MSDEEKPSAEEDPTGVVRFFKKFKKPGNPKQSTRVVPFSPSTAFVDLTLGDDEEIDDSREKIVLDSRNRKSTQEQRLKRNMKTYSRSVRHHFIGVPLRDRQPGRFIREIRFDTVQSEEDPYVKLKRIRRIKMNTYLDHDYGRAFLRGNDEIMMDNGFWDDEDEDFVHFLRLYAPVANCFLDEGPVMYEEENEEDWVRVPEENIGRGIENDVISVGEAEGSVLDSDSENEDGFEIIPRKQMSRTYSIEERTKIHKKAEMDENNLIYRIRISDRFENQTFSDVSGSDSEEEESSVSDEGKKSKSCSAENKINQYFCNNFFETKEILKHFDGKMDMRKKLECKEEVLTKNSSRTRLSTNKKSPLIIFMNQLFRPKSENKDGSVVATCTFTDVNNKCCPGSIHVCRKTGVIAEHSDCTHPPRRNHIGVQRVELIIRRMVLMELGGSSAKVQHDTAIEMADFYKVSKSLKSNVTTEWFDRKVKDLVSVARCSNQFPPCFDWLAIKNVTNLLDSSGNFNNRLPITYVWKVQGSEKWLNSNTKTLHLDGKFSEIPTGFRQVLKVGYKSPNLILKSDFENAVIGAVTEVWPQAKINLCHRHWKVAIKRKLKDIVGGKLLKTDVFKRLLKTVYSLAFAPLNKAPHYLTFVRLRTSSLHPRIDAFFKYLKNTYFDSTAMFKSPLWNCRERASREQEFTNNPSERMFSVYSRLFSHNNYQQLSVAVRRSSDWAESVYKQEQLGFKPKSKAKRCPLYKNKSFKDVVTKDYPTFDDFEKSIHSFMKIPSLGH
ncbi:hypothetical protein CAEBREN_25597 [Caenorhabditis brenneri]|uniref:MULE transposase domain-containing protein n=1 Tax=Caenorhabditis brenneri TaxID=135651 RepID=G0P6M2_CAEBE|nr:hypothetical protein CAEBREN_25597 [Caenorhabditis brenneri]